MLLGNVLFLIGCVIFNSAPTAALILMYISRIVIGAGVCFYGITLNTILHTFFYAGELSFSLGIGPIHSRTGLAAGQFFSYFLWDRFRALGVNNPIAFSIAFTIILATISLIWNYIGLSKQLTYIRDFKRFMVLKAKQAQSESTQIDPGSAVTATFDETEASTTADGAVSETKKSWKCSCSCFRGFQSFPASFWIVVLIAGLGYIPFLGFIVIGVTALMEIYGMSAVWANNLLLITNLAALLACFAVGALIDRFGRIPLFFVICGLCYITGHLGIIFDESASIATVAVYLCILGIGFACFATTMWTSVALLSGKNTGTGNGVAYFFYAIFYAFGQYIAGLCIRPEETNGHIKYHVMFVYLIFVALLIACCGVTLFILDRKRNHSKLWNYRKGN
jgi:hypothetical protein